MAPDSSSMEDAKKGLGMGWGCRVLCFNEGRIGHPQFFVLLGFLKNVLAQSSMNVKQALIFFLICSHVLGAPKRKKPEEGFWAPQQVDMPEKAKAGKRLGDKLTGLYKKKQTVS